MIDVELSLRNYRCFGDEPVRLRIADGFTALVGTNNSGKSSLLRMPYEIRGLLSMLSVGTTNPSQQMLNGATIENVWRPGVPLGERIFRTGTDRPIELEITVRNGPKGRFEYESEQLVFAVSFDRQGRTITTMSTANGVVIT